MRKCPKIEAVNAVVALVSSLRMRSFSRTEFLTKCVCAGQINTQQLLASAASVRARVHFHLPLFFRRFHSSRRRRFFLRQWCARGCHRHHRARPFTSSHLDSAFSLTCSPHTIFTSE